MECLVVFATGIQRTFLSVGGVVMLLHPEHVGILYPHPIICCTLRALYRHQESVVGTALTPQKASANVRAMYAKHSSPSVNVMFFRMPKELSNSRRQRLRICSPRCLEFWISGAPTRLLQESSIVLVLLLPQYVVAMWVVVAFFIRAL